MEYSGTISSFTNLEAWKHGHTFVLMVYSMTKMFPQEELYGLTSQLRRAAVSITSNIAEGFKRETYKEKVRFYSISLSSVSEVQNQLLIAKDVNYINKEEFKKLAEQSIIVSKLLFGLLRAFKKRI